MKTVRNRLITKEDAQKFESVGSAAEPKNDYTKADFLPPSKVAEKFGVSTEKVKTLMQQMERHNKSFVLNGRMARVVVNLGKKGCLYLHPMAIDIFKQHLIQQKG